MNGNSSQYTHSWHQFRAQCTAKAKNRCILTNKNWIKLKKWHLEQYLKHDTVNPFGFLFRLKTSNNVLFADKVIRGKYFTLLKRKIQRKKEQELRRMLILNKK